MLNRPNRAVALLFVVLAAIVAIALARHGGPDPKPSDAPAGEFSAARATDVLRRILGDGAPHPTGVQPAHDAVRDRVAGELRALGYVVTLHPAFHCTEWGECAQLTNIVALHPNAPAGSDTLLLAAHYDSRPAGPGASDDGCGVASLIEVARAIRGERFRNRIAIVVTDSEEWGLLGAEAFAADPNLMRDVAAVVNVEARGTSGPSYLFETSSHNQWLIRRVATALPRPIASSLFFSIYERMPNDTDLTIFKRAGKAGVNFAFIGSPSYYHTAIDDLQHVTPSTLQHHGDNLLAAARALGESELRQTSRGNATYFDVLSLFLIWWPERLTIVFAVIVFVALIVAALRLMRANATRSREITFGVLAFFLALVNAIILGVILSRVARLRSFGMPWVAEPTAAIAAMWLCGIAAALLAAFAFRRFARFDGLFLGQAFCWCAIAIVLTFALPGAAYLALLPAGASAVGALLRTRRGGAGASIGAVSIVAASIAMLLLAALGSTLYSALSSNALPGIALILALIATTFAPLVIEASAGRAVLATVFVAAIVASLVAMRAPAYTRAVPRQLSVSYFLDADAHRANWVASGTLAGLQPFDPTPRALVPWGGAVNLAAAPLLDVAPPEARVAARDGERMTLLLHSARQASRIALVFRQDDVAAVRVGGFLIAPPPAGSRRALGGGWRRIEIRGRNDVPVELTTIAGRRPEAYLLDISLGLPPEGAPLARARDASLAVRADQGDLTTVMRRVAF